MCGGPFARAEVSRSGAATQLASRRATNRLVKVRREVCFGGDVRAVIPRLPKACLDNLGRGRGSVGAEMAFRLRAECGEVRAEETLERGLITQRSDDRFGSVGQRRSGHAALREISS